MFRASPWISYDPSQRQSPISTDRLHNLPFDPTSSSQELHSPQEDMDAPEISTLREEEEETPPPDSAGLSFSKFRVNLRLPQWNQGPAASGSAVGPPVGPSPVSRRVQSPPDSDDEDEEDQLIDDDELAIVTETGRGLTTSSPPGLVAAGSPSSTPSPRKRGGVARGRQRRGGVTGRRGRPGREPPDAAAMMSTFEVTKADQPGPSTAQIVPPAPLIVGTPPQVAGSSTGDWSTASPPKPTRKKPGPKKGSTLGPRGPRKTAVKTAHNTPGTSTPILDDPLLGIDPSAFLIPAPPSIPPTPGPDQNTLPPPQLPPILPPDFNLDPSIPIPSYPLPTRSYPVQQPPKVPSGYAPTHSVDIKRGPVRKWTVMQREIKGIAGGRWFARTWVAPHPTGGAPQPPTRPSSPPIHSNLHLTISSSSRLAAEAGPSRVEVADSRASSVRPEPVPVHPLSDSEHAVPPHWPTSVRDIDGGFSSRGPASPRTRTSTTPSPPPLAATTETQPELS